MNDLCVSYVNEDELYDLAITIYNFDHKETNSKKPKNYYLFYKGLIKMYNFLCPTCKLKRCDEIHRIDKNKENNDKRNLMFLCRKCHIKLHYLNDKDYSRINEIQEKMGLDLITFDK